MSSQFFAYLSRMKLIRRWSLMYNTRTENIQEHSAQVAMIAHALGLVANKYYGGSVDLGRLTLLALYHDVGEVIIGDLPSPVKYFNPQIKNSYGDIENIAKEKLLSFLPADLHDDYRPYIFPADDKEHVLVKAADKIAAYTKCLEEAMSGNRDFARAEVALLDEIKQYSDLPEVQYFMDNFVQSFRLTIDELG